MAKPRILLCPQFSEVEWSTAPQIREWAEVATFDAPGVGDEPIPGDDPALLTREMIVERALEKLDALGWDSYFLVGDAWGAATAVRAAVARPEPVLGIALGHAAPSYDSGGKRPQVIGEITAAMTQLMRTDYESFVRYGITQLTQGGFDEETSGRMVERFPRMEVAARVWEVLIAQHEPVAEMLAELDKPLLLVKHEGCLAFTPEGYDDVVAAFPGAHTASVPVACPASPDFAEALRGFCETVLKERN